MKGEFEIRAGSLWRARLGRPDNAGGNGSKRGVGNGGLPGEVFRFAMAAVLPFLLAGCVTTTELVPLQQSVQTLGLRIQELEERVGGLERRIHGAEGRQAEKDEGPTLADMHARLEAFQVKLGSLEGRLEEQERRSLAAPVSSSSASVSPRPPSSAQASSSPMESTGSEAAPSSGASGGTLYDKGLQWFQEGEFSRAREAFLDFLRSDPKAGLADNALYWVGECYFEEQKYREAVEAYQKLLDRYPKGNKAPYGLLKQGVAYERLGDSTAARILYKRIVENYPNTPQAQIAQKKLDQL